MDLLTAPNAGSATPAAPQAAGDMTLKQDTDLVDEPLAERRGDPLACVDAAVHKDRLAARVLPADLWKSHIGCDRA